MLKNENTFLDEVRRKINTLSFCLLSVQNLLPFKTMKIRYVTVPVTLFVDVYCCV